MLGGVGRECGGGAYQAVRKGGRGGSEGWAGTRGETTRLGVQWWSTSKGKEGEGEGGGRGRGREVGREERVEVRRGSILSIEGRGVERGGGWGEGTRREGVWGSGLYAECVQGARY